MGYTDLGIDEATQHESNEDPEEDSETYEILVNSDYAQFFVRLSTGNEYGVVSYPYDVDVHIGQSLSESDLNEILQGRISEAERTEAELWELQSRAGAKIIQNTPTETLRQAKFNLLYYGSDGRVSYSSLLHSTGFPIRFQSYQTFYPYEQNLSLRQLDEHIKETLNVGNQARRYIESSMSVNKEDKTPKEYTLQFHH
jgi:hypothetical protein